ncbi:hypothetical protein CsSME_00011544 [Camellia sinensis var. sinensis]
MPVAASAICFLNLHGDVLINRLYCDDVGGTHHRDFSLYKLHHRDFF